MKIENGGLVSVYRAIVEDNIDPLELGRIRIRVPFLHGNNLNRDFISNDNLPFAKPCMIYASYDAGSLLVPEVGSMVFVLFENGEVDKPIYIGQMFSKGSDVASNIGYPGSGSFIDFEGKRIKRAYKDDTIQGSYFKGVLRKLTLFKTPKGSTIEFNENDREEYLGIFDRLGQAFVMHSPTTPSYNDKGMGNRGLFTVLKQKFNKLISIPSIIILKALSGSFIRFTSSNEKSKTELVCVYEDEEAGVHVSIGEGNRVLVFYGNSKFEIKDKSITADTTIFNINANNINLHAEEINSSSMIKVGTSSKVDVQDYVNDKDEDSIIE